ncbi:7724_t:CDS:2 [Entrophospora sp. SA101]|nr:7724_t:CDS:2 [Entrophospora sp. SA101]
MQKLFMMFQETKVKVLFKEGHRKKKAIREDELSIEEPLKNVSLKDRKVDYGIVVIGKSLE